MAQLKVIAGGEAKRFAPSCIVTMDNSIDRFTDFVTVGWDYNKDCTVIVQNADTITLGFAYLMIAKAFKDSYDSLTDEERLIVDKTFA
jgi:citrate lyase synthetase